MQDEILYKDLTERLSFKAIQENGELVLETKEKSVITGYITDFRTKLSVNGEYGYYIINFGAFKFAFNEVEYQSFIDFISLIKNSIGEWESKWWKHCNFGIKLFGFDVSVSDHNGCIEIIIENRMICEDKFSRYIFADVLKYLEERKNV